MKASDVRKGTVIMYNKTPHRIMDFHHHTPGNLRAMVQTKMRNLLSGNQTEVRFSSTEELEEADVMTASATYMYADNEGLHFMFKESFEEITISRETLGDGAYYLQDQMEVEITTFEGAAIGVNLPQTVILTIEDTEPELKGSTASNSPKPAKTDTGLTLTVPAFVKIGDRIIVNTQEGKYISRAD